MQDRRSLFLIAHSPHTPSIDLTPSSTYAQPFGLAGILDLPEHVSDTCRRRGTLTSSNATRSTRKAKTIGHIGPGSGTTAKVYDIGGIAPSIPSYGVTVFDSRLSSKPTRYLTVEELGRAATLPSSTITHLNKASKRPPGPASLL